MTLFMSFTTLLNGLARGQITNAQLLNAQNLFAFNCAREHAFSPDAEELFYYVRCGSAACNPGLHACGEKIEARISAGERIREALRIAENEGRVFWWRDFAIPGEFGDEKAAREWLTRNGVAVDQYEKCSRERGAMYAAAILAGVEVM